VAEEVSLHQMVSNAVRQEPAGASPVLAEGVVVRPMNKDDVPEVGQIHKEAFAGYMNTRLGASYTRAFLRWFLTSKGASALVAREPHGTIVGYVLGAPIDYGPAMNRDLLFTAATSVIIRPWLFFSQTFWTIVAGRIRSTFNIAPAHKPVFRYPEPAMSLVALGVASCARGKKIGLCLLLAFEDKARELGVRSLQLTVYRTNVAARKLYEANGWTALQEEAGEETAIQYFRYLQDEAIVPGA